MLYTCLQQFSGDDAIDCGTDCPKVLALAEFCPDKWYGCDTACQAEIANLATMDHAPTSSDTLQMSAATQALFECAQSGGLIDFLDGAFSNQHMFNVMACAVMRSSELRPCFPPAPAPPVAVTVNAVVLTGDDFASASNAVALALAAQEQAAAEIVPGAAISRPPPQAEIRSSATFPIEIVNIAAGSPQREQFEVR